MFYYLEFGAKAMKEILKLKNNESIKNIFNKANELKENPQKGDYLFGNCYELKAQNFRLYYFLHKGIVNVEGVQFIGKVNVERFGTKDTQKRDIAYLRSL